MKLLLTPDLLKFLSNEGYKYCFSKTEELTGKATDCCITLTPIRWRPYIKRLPLKYDTFFSINDEPVQLADGLDDTLVMVSVDIRTMLTYIQKLLPLRKQFSLA
jgi:hypothetical protein